MPSEWAMEIAKRIADLWYPADILPPVIAEALDAARAQGRREGLEDAARIAARASHGGDECCCEKCLTSRLIESDIRAAIAKEPTA